MKATRSCSCLLVGLIVAAVGCSKGSGGSPGETGGAGSPGASASGGKNGSGDANGSGGAAGGQNGGGNAGAGAGGLGGSAPATGLVGATGAGGDTTSSGGYVTGGATGGGAAGGSAGSAGAQTGGVGGLATGGAPATGGQGSGGRNTGGGTGGGGVATGGSVGSTGGQGGSAMGGSSGSGGGATGGASGLGGSAAGGASGTGGKTGNADASTSGYHPCPTDGTACKIMPFGDSITDGYNSDTPGGYRVELFRLAHSAGKNVTFVGSATSQNAPSTVDGVSFPRRHEGHSGWTIYPTGGRKGISQCLQANPDCLSSNSVMPEYTPHFVLLMIGTNDAIDNYDMANAPKRLGTLIDTIYTQLPNVFIVVAQPIPSRGDASKGDDTALSGRIKAYDDAIPAVVQARADAGKHIAIVDMYTPFNSNKASLIEDQWHPNLQGYVLLGAQWYSVLKSLL